MTMGDQIGGSFAPLCTHPPSGFVPRKGFLAQSWAGGQPHAQPFQKPTASEWESWKVLTLRE